MDIISKLPELRNVIREVRTSLHAGTQMTDVLNLVARKATEVLSAKGALVRVLDVETHELKFRAAFGMDEQYLSKGPATNQEHIVELCKQNEIVIIKDILTDPRLQCPQEAWQQGVRMVIDAPLIVKRPLVGILRLHFSEIRILGQVEMNFMISIAEQCASAIDKAQLIETQRYQYDQLALQTEKLSALGRMAAAIAHEINNPLAGILLYSSRLEKKVSPDGPVKEGLQIITDEAKRCRGIIENLLEFSRHDEPRKAPANVNDVVEQALAIMDNEFRLRHIRLSKHLAGNLPEVFLDTNQMEQVFINLLINAAEAIEDDGTIDIISHMEPDGERLVVEICDTGCGISEDVMANIFEPFFSTKTKGTGLGLSVSYGIVKNHRGIVEVSSQLGRGTRFTVVLPVLQRTAAVEKQADSNETH